MTPPGDVVRQGIGLGLAVLMLAGAGHGAESGFKVERHSPAEGSPSLGPATAKNTLVFFTDYQ